MAKAKNVNVSWPISKEMETEPFIPKVRLIRENFEYFIQSNFFGQIMAEKLCLSLEILIGLFPVK